jgi:hypothetical protein
MGRSGNTKYSRIVACENVLFGIFVSRLVHSSARTVLTHVIVMFVDLSYVRLRPYPYHRISLNSCPVCNSCGVDKSGTTSGDEEQIIT